MSNLCARFRFQRLVLQYYPVWSAGGIRYLDRRPETYFTQYGANFGVSLAFIFLKQSCHLMSLNILYTYISLNDMPNSGLKVANLIEFCIVIFQALAWHLGSCLIAYHGRWLRHGWFDKSLRGTVTQIMKSRTVEFFCITSNNYWKWSSYWMYHVFFFSVLY